MVDQEDYVDVEEDKKALRLALRDLLDEVEALEQKSTLLFWYIAREHEFIYGAEATYPLRVAIASGDRATLRAYTLEYSVSERANEAPPIN